MTFPITDAQVERAFRQAVKNPADMRGILEAALDRRIGDKDRRKVRDGKLRYYGFEGDERRVKSTGRREGDKLCWQNLPLAEPPIQVSEGMIAAGRPHIIAGYEEKPQYYCIDLAAIYVAMEKARRKESGFDGPDRRSGNQRRQPFWRQHWRLDQAPPWAVRGDAGRDRTRKGRRKTDNP